MSSPLTGSPPGSEGNQGLRPLCLGLTWTLTIIAVAAVATRFRLRLKFEHHLGIDDWTMLLALMLQLVYQGLFTQMCHWGNGLPQPDLTQYQQLKITKWSYISAIPSILISVIARVSIAILLIRIFGTKRWFKIFLGASTAFLALMGILSLAFLGASSRPWYGLWSPTVKAKKFDLRYYSYTALGLQILMAVSDLLYVLFPILIIWRLNMRVRTKLAIMFLMGVSLLTMAIATAKVTLVFIRLSGNVQGITATKRYFQSLVNLVADCEQCLVITLGCVPALRLLSNFKIRIKIPTIRDVSFWLVSLIPGIRSSRSRSRDRELSVVYNTPERQPPYQDLEHEGMQDSKERSQAGPPREVVVDMEGGTPQTGR